MALIPGVARCLVGELVYLLGSGKIVELDLAVFYLQKSDPYIQFHLNLSLLHLT